MPSEISVKNRLTIQMRKYSAADPVNSGRTTRGTLVQIRPPLRLLLALVPGSLADAAGYTRALVLKRMQQAPPRYRPGEEFPLKRRYCVERLARRPRYCR